MDESFMDGFWRFAQGSIRHHPDLASAQVFSDLMAPLADTVVDFCVSFTDCIVARISSGVSARSSCLAIERLAILALVGPVTVGGE